jgi:protein MpaA
MRLNLKLLALTALVTLGITAQAPRADEIEKTIPDLCSGLDKAFQKRSWGKNPCIDLEWKSNSTSVQGRPLIYYSFGPEDSKNVTLILSMVHGDEITPLYLGFKMAEWAKDNMKNSPKARLIIAPLVNPDGFFGYPKTRMNAHGVDCNRNFMTNDWDQDALKSWKTKMHSEKRRFPGYKPDSEPETLFQKDLIDRFKPNKIISIHSPLNLMDYDGPDHLKLQKFYEDYVKKCEELRTKVKAKSSGFFPGSLGNFAGQEQGIPTITLELPTADPTKAKEYWVHFKKGLETVVNHEMPPKKQKQATPKP